MSVVATDRAVYRQNPPTASDTWVRLGWEQVARVDWDADRGGLVLTGLTPGVPARTVLAVPRREALVDYDAERLRNALRAGIG